MPILRRYAAFPAVVIPLALALFCGGGQNNPAAAEENGILEIRARVVSKALAKSGAASETVADSLVVEISAVDMKTMIIKRKLDLSRPSVSDTLTKIPPGKNRSVTIWVVDKKGEKTHIDSLVSRTVNIEEQKVTPVYATLIPAAGSIYLQFINLPSNCSVVYARFVSYDEKVIVENSVNKATRTFLSLDNIPHDADGILTVILKGATGDTVKIAVVNDMTFNARSDSAIDLEFNETGGRMAVDVAVYVPGVTVGSYNYSKSSESSVNETGELIITEIMWSAVNDNYIELYNPANDVFFDMLTTDIDGTKRYFDSVTIAPKGYVVIGRQNLPYVDIFTPTTGGLPITSTGNWITVRRGKDGPVIDRVICAGGNSATGWPPVSGKRSIELARDKYSATDNNYGKNWSAASEFINEESPYYGSPGR